MWAQIFNTILGIWLMTAPSVLGYNGTAGDNDHIIGPVVASFAIIALSGCTRAVAMYNLPLGTWLLLAPWVLNYQNESAIFNDISVGFFVTIFSLIKRKTDQQYGGGWQMVWKKPQPAN